MKNIQLPHPRHASFNINSNCFQRPDWLERKKQLNFTAGCVKLLNLLYIYCNYSQQSQEAFLWSLVGVFVKRREKEREQPPLLSSAVKLVLII